MPRLRRAEAHGRRDGLTLAAVQVSLPSDMAAAIVAHARAELPNEACGLIAGDAWLADGGRPLRWIPTRNVLASPCRFEIDPDELLRASLAIDDAGEVVWAIVHSHVASPARPSATDLREAHHPAAVQLIVSLDPAEAEPGTDGPGLRAWRIRGDALDEIAIELEGAPPTDPAE